MRRLLLLPIFIGLCLTAHAQSYTIKSIVFPGAAPYPESDLLTIVGLKPGAVITKAGLQEAAQRLVDSGYFDKVQGTVEGPIKAVEARFAVKPIDPAKLYPATFRNIVWLSPEELAAFVKSTPLLSFGLPEAGTGQAAAQTALEALLQQKSITASLSHELIEPSTSQPHRLVEYRVESPRISLHKASLNGVGAAMTTAVNAALNRAQGGAYNEGLAGRSTAEALLQPWYDLGDIDAHLDNLQRSIAPESTPQRVLVDVKATVVAGEPYRVSAIQFAETPVESAAAFAKTVRLHPGGLASRRDLLASLVPVTAAYHSQGYMDAVVDALPTPDAAAHLVAYTITIAPGEPYHLRNITVTGLPTSARADFDYAFALHPGDVYDESYVGTFLVHNNNVGSLAAYNGAFAASADPNTHLLDLTIKFATGNAITVH